MYFLINWDYLFSYVSHADFLEMGLGDSEKGTEERGGDKLYLLLCEIILWIPTLQTLKLLWLSCRAALFILAVVRHSSYMKCSPL